MHKSNLPSIISSTHNEVIQSCLIYTKFAFLGLRNGFIEIFEYKTNIKKGEITNLFDKETKKTEKELALNPHSNQIISIQLIKELSQKEKEILLFIQSRGGIIFIIKCNIEKNISKMLIKYSTNIETFTEFFIYDKIFRAEWGKEKENSYKIIYPLEKNNEIEILFYDSINEDSDSISCNSLQKINQNFDYIIDEDGQKILDVYKDMESKIMQIIQLSKEDNADYFFAMIYEKTLLFILDEKLNYVAHYSLSFSLKLYEAIINIYSFKFNNNYYVCIGLFSQNLVILKFDSDKKELNFYQIINNICPEVKYGISCFANGVVKTDDLFADDELIESKFLLFVGTYSKRVKIFELIKEENEESKVINKKENIKFNDLGNLIVDNSGAINQIHFRDGNLFVVCDRKILYIYSI